MDSTGGGRGGHPHARRRRRPPRSWTGTWPTARRCSTRRPSPRSPSTTRSAEDDASTTGTPITATASRSTCAEYNERGVLASETLHVRAAKQTAADRPPIVHATRRRRQERRRHPRHHLERQGPAREPRARQRHRHQLRVRPGRPSGWHLYAACRDPARRPTPASAAAAEPALHVRPGRQRHPHRGRRAGHHLVRQPAGRAEPRLRLRRAVPADRGDRPGERRRAAARRRMPRGTGRPGAFPSADDAPQLHPALPLRPASATS